MLDWPADKLSIPKIDQKIVKSYILNGEEFEIQYKSDLMEVSIPEDHRKSCNTILVFEIDGDVLDIEDKNPTVFMNLRTSVLLQEPAYKFSGNGAKSLTNKVEGVPSNLYEEWLGYEDSNFEAVIDLSTSKTISKVIIGSMDNQDRWIFLPKKIEVLLSDDNENFLSAGIINIDLKETKNASRKEIEIPINQVQARYVKVVVHNIGTCPDWHKGSGGKAWLFVDEVEIR